MENCGSLPQSTPLYPNKNLCERDPQLQVFGRLYIGHSMIKRHMMKMINYYKEQTDVVRKPLYGEHLGITTPKLHCVMRPFYYSIVINHYCWWKNVVLSKVIERSDCRFMHYKKTSLRRTFGYYDAQIALRYASLLL